MTCVLHCVPYGASNGAHETYRAERLDVKRAMAAAHAAAAVVAGQVAGALGGGGGRHGEVSAAAEQLATAGSLAALAAYVRSTAAATFSPDGTPQQVNFLLPDTRPIPMLEPLRPSCSLSVADLQSCILQLRPLTLLHTSLQQVAANAVAVGTWRSVQSCV